MLTPYNVFSLVSSLSHFFDDIHIFINGDYFCFDLSTVTNRYIRIECMKEGNNKADVTFYVDSLLRNRVTAKDIDSLKLFISQFFTDIIPDKFYFQRQQYME